jgi:hypothetical protein
MCPTLSITLSLSDNLLNSDTEPVVGEQVGLSVAIIYEADET